MTPRDKALAEFLEELAGYVLAPQGNYADQRAQNDEQRERAIRAQVWLQSAAQVLRDHRKVSKYLSAEELHANRLGLVREHAAKPLPYAPYEANPEPAGGQS